MAKELWKGAPKDALKNSLKKVRKTASQKQKSKAESTPKPRTAEPQTNLITHTQTNEKEDTASQMQKMLDEMRMKDPELFKSILAANMVSFIVPNCLFMLTIPSFRVNLRIENKIFSTLQQMIPVPLR